MAKKITGFEAMRNMLATLQGFQIATLSVPDVLFSIDVRDFEDGDYGVLLTLNKGDEWEHPVVYSCEYSNTAKNRNAMISKTKKTLKKWGVKL